MPLSSTSTEATPATFAHGMNSKIIANGVAFCITKFEFERKQDKHDVTTTCNNGKRQYQAGLQGVDFNGEAKLDLSETPYTVLPTGSAVSITWSSDGTTVNFSSAKCVIESAKVTSMVSDVITWTFSGSAGSDFVIA
jgi:hypothetical protein